MASDTLSKRIMNEENIEIFIANRNCRPTFIYSLHAQTHDLSIVLFLGIWQPLGVTRDKGVSQMRAWMSRGLSLSLVEIAEVLRVKLGKACVYILCKAHFGNPRPVQLIPVCVRQGWKGLHLIYYNQVFYWCWVCNFLKQN